jgi:hypothetical protein
MSNQQIGTVVGGVIGYFFGYPQLGLVVGSLLGAALTPGTKSEGPRLTDKAVSSSQYGGGITRVYGTRRVGGTIVDSTNKIEVPTTTHQGKGGGNDNTTYQYFVNMAMVLCETPSDGSVVYVRKMWKDGKLIYDASTGISIGSALASATSPFSFSVLYQGAEDQLPDPLEELQHGVGNVPAYRGVVRLRLNIIECIGGRVPQFSVEIARGATFQTEVIAYSVAPSNYDTTSSIGESGIFQFGNGESGSSATRDVYAVGPGYANRADSYSIAKSGSIADFGRIACQTSYAPRALNYALFSEPGKFARQSIYFYSLDGSANVVDLVCATTSDVIRLLWCAYDDVSDSYATVASDSNRIVFLPSLLTSDVMSSVGRPVAFYDGIAYTTGARGGATYLDKYSGVNGHLIASIATTATSAAGLLVCANKHGVYVLDNTAAVGAHSIWKVEPTGWRLLVGDADLGNSVSVKTFFANDEFATIGGVNDSSTTIEYKTVRFNVLTPVASSVAGIISSECQKAGLTLAQIDTSSIAQTLWGYTITNLGSARANIQPLMTAFAIDATEENGKIRFFNRADIASVVTIPFDELGTADGGSVPGDPMPLTRGQEAELPRSVAVTYLDATFDYQQATEKAIRVVTHSVTDQTFDLPLALNGGSVAAKVAQQVLYDAWSDRNKRSLKVSRKYAYLSAGDGFKPEYPRGTFQMRRITKITDTGLLLEIECVDSDASIYTQTAVGSSYTGQSVEPLSAPLRQVILDIPILRDADNNAGIYAAIDSYAQVPAEGALWVGYNDSTLTVRGTVAASAPIGFAETVLSQWSQNLIDETNVFIINLNDDVPASCTRDVLLSGGGEYWAYGAPGRWEIGASASSAALGNGRFSLSRHLRGQFGTEANSGLHVAGDTFVLLRSVGILRPVMSVGDIGQVMSYRAVAKGLRLDAASSLTYTNTGEGLKPLSPVNVRRAFGSRDIQADRRSRLAMNNNSGALPLGEVVESYLWKFYVDGTFSALIGQATTSTGTIAAAQQTAIGVTPSAAAFVGVSLISDSVGAGHEQKGTL